MTTEELNAIKERVKKATEGPWTWGSIHYLSNGCVWRTLESDSGLVLRHEGDNWLPSIDDQNFIAHARDDVQLLVDEVERLTNQNSLLLVDKENDCRATVALHSSLRVKDEALRAASSIIWPNKPHSPHVEEAVRKTIDAALSDAGKGG